MDNIHIVELSKLTTPNVIEVKNKDWVAYGDDNNYFQFIIDRYVNSTTNKTVIDSVCNWIYGKGLSALDSNIKLEQYAQLMSLLKKQDLKRFIKDRYLLGMGCLQIVKKAGKVKSITHFPMETLRAGKLNGKGELDTWLYHPNWVECKKKDEATAFPAFGFGGDNATEMYVCKPYIAGYTYYAPVSYSLEYALLEEEVADFLINDVQNGFSGTKVINFNNGEVDERRQLEIKNKVTNKLTGSLGEKVIVSFNRDETKKTTVDNIPLDDAPTHYEYLSNECRDKILLSHKVTSPLLLGIRDTGGGLGSNSDEIKNATLLFDNIVIKPLQEEILDHLEAILTLNDINLELYFKTIEPLEFIDTTGMDEETKEEETGIEQDLQKFSKQDKLDDLIGDALISLGDEETDGWELVDEADVDYDTEEELDAKIDELNGKNKTALSKFFDFVRTGTARPNAKSEQDTEIDGAKYKVRYEYYPKKVSANSRLFCKKMVQANKMYRKEDILKMDSQVVNAGWGLNGADTYSIWLYKGGGGCHHKWRRKTFKFTGVGKGDTKSPLAPTISTNKGEKEGYRVRNPKEVAMRPKDMPNQGFVNK